MNKKKALLKLQEIMNSSNLVIHPAVISDIMKILKNSGQEAKVFATLAARLEFLSNHKQAASVHKEFEPLGDGVYSMHVAVSSINLRVLYTFRDPNTILLLAFYERAGKSHTDYTGKKKIALERLEELL